MRAWQQLQNAAKHRAPAFDFQISEEGLSVQHRNWSMLHASGMQCATNAAPVKETAPLCLSSPLSIRHGGWLLAYAHQLFIDVASRQGQPDPFCHRGGLKHVLHLSALVTVDPKMQIEPILQRLNDVRTPDGGRLPSFWPGCIKQISQLPNRQDSN